MSVFRSLYGVMVALFALVRETLRLFAFDPPGMIAATFQHMFGDKNAAQERVTAIIVAKRLRNTPFPTLTDAELEDRGLPTSRDAQAFAEHIIDEYRR